MDFKDRNHIIISINTEKSFGKNPESLHDISPRKNNVRKNIHQHHKGSVCKPVVNIMLNREESEATV